MTSTFTFTNIIWRRMTVSKVCKYGQSSFKSDQSGPIKYKRSSLLFESSCSYRGWSSHTVDHSLPSTIYTISLSAQDDDWFSDFGFKVSSQSELAPRLSSKPLDAKLGPLTTWHFLCARGSIWIFSTWLLFLYKHVFFTHIEHPPGSLRFLMFI